MSLALIFVLLIQVKVSRIGKTSKITDCDVVIIDPLPIGVSFVIGVITLN